MGYEEDAAAKTLLRQARAGLENRGREVADPEKAQAKRPVSWRVVVADGYLEVCYPDAAGRFWTVHRRDAHPLELPDPCPVIGLTYRAAAIEGQEGKWFGPDEGPDSAVNVIVEHVERELGLK